MGKEFYANHIEATGEANDGTSNPIEVYNSDNTKSFEIRDNGHYRSLGNSWKDMIMDLFGRQLTSTAGKVDYDFDENCMVFEPGGVITNANDRVCGNQEINHEFKVGTNITFYAHLHWWQQVTSNTVKPIVFTARYRLQRNNTAKTTAWTTITANAGAGGDDVFDFTAQANGLYNQITRFDPITITCGISDTLQIQMTRTDAQTGNVSVTFFDIHGQVDSDGSDNELSKT